MASLRCESCYVSALTIRIGTMFRLTAFLLAGLYLALLIGGADRGQQRFGLRDVPVPTVAPKPVAVVETVAAEPEPAVKTGGESVADPAAVAAVAALPQGVGAMPLNALEVDAAFLQDFAGDHRLGAEERRELGRGAPEVLGGRVVMGQCGVAVPTFSTAQLGEVVGVVDSRYQTAREPEFGGALGDATFHGLIPKNGLPESQKRSIPGDSCKLRQDLFLGGTSDLHL